VVDERQEGGGWGIAAILVIIHQPRDQLPILSYLIPTNALQGGVDIFLRHKQLHYDAYDSRATYNRTPVHEKAPAEDRLALLDNVIDHRWPCTGCAWVIP
jgi:hypothetical protein